MSFRGDVAHSVRTLGAEPGWTAVAVLTLGLGIGANAALFSVVDHALLRPLPYPHADRLVSIWGVEASVGPARLPTSYPDFIDYRDTATRSFEGMAAYRPLTVTLSGPGLEAVRLDAGAASHEFFGVLGVTPIVGRTFTPEENRAGAPGAVVVSEGLWRELWGGRRDVVGTAVTIDSTPHAVIGVLPASFNFPRQARLWVPAARQPRTEFRGVHGHRVVGRLREDVSVEQAGAELASVAGQLAATYPEDNAGRTAKLERLQDSLVGNTRPALVMLLGAVVLVLVITCANLAALIVTRAARRTRELAVRVSLGATRGRLVRQLLTETAVVAFLGAAAAVALAAWMVPTLVALAPADLPRIEEVVFDRRVALVSLLVTVLTACLFGVAPAVVATRVAPADVLRAGAGRASAGRARQRLRQGLSLGQTALAVVLLTGAGLLLRSLSALGQVEPGFATTGVLTAEVQLPESRYKTWSEWSRFYASLAERVQALPGVDAVAVASGDPFDPGFGARFGIEGRTPFPRGQEPEPAVRVVTPGYLATTGLRLVSGRDLSPSDRAGAPGVVLVNEAFAARYFPGESPLGRYLSRTWWAPEMPQRWEIVGVVSDVRTGTLDTPPEDAIYYPAGQVSFAGMTLLVRTARDPMAMAGEVQKAIRGLDPEVPLGKVLPIDRVLAESLGSRRFQAVVLGLFAGLALLLAAIGIYGVLAYAVAQRGREIAVRLALGAARGDVIRLVAREGGGVVASGLAAGLVGGLLLTRLLRGMLFEVQPLDPPTLVTVVAAVAVAAALAGFAPLRRALAVEPAAALRAE